MGRTDAELARYDVAAVNLACARGLPGAEEIDEEGCLRFLDRCAWAVRKETGRITPQFQRRPATFNHSWAFFRSMVLVTVLQRDFGIHYNPALINLEFPSGDSRAAFLHGITRTGAGSCASLPVLYVAVGRRLGYPLKLVATGGHLFVRWEDAEERLNIEGTNAGMWSPPDDYYRTGRYAVPPEKGQEHRFLRPQTPREELADFLVQRAFCRLGGGQEGKAVKSFAWAAAVDGCGQYLGLAMSALFKWSGLVQAAMPPGFPPVALPDWPRVWPSLPESFERDVALFSAIEGLLRRPGLPLALARGGGPRQIVVEGAVKALWNI